MKPDGTGGVGVIARSPHIVAVRKTVDAWRSTATDRRRRYGRRLRLSAGRLARAVIIITAQRRPPSAAHRPASRRRAAGTCQTPAHGARVRMPPAVRVRPDVRPGTGRRTRASRNNIGTASRLGGSPTGMQIFVNAARRFRRIFVRRRLLATGDLFTPAKSEMF